MSEQPETSEITDLASCCQWLRRQHPRPQTLELPSAVVQQMRKDAEDMHLVRPRKPDPHSAQNPWGGIDAELYEMEKEMRHTSPITVYGVLICETREHK